MAKQDVNMDSRHDTGGLVGEKRAEALAKVARCQFYRSECVKRFNSKILLCETLKTRDEHAKIKRQMEAAAEEETKKLMAKIRERELKAVEQEREKIRRRERERAANHEGLMQQLRSADLTSSKLEKEKEKEVKECQRWCERYEREKAELRRRQQVEKVSARKAHELHISTRDAIRAREAQRLAEEEEQRRLVDKVTALRVRTWEEAEADRRRECERHKQRLVDRMAAQLQEKVAREEELCARAAAQASTHHGQELERKLRDAEKAAAELRAIAALREEKRLARQRKAQEEEKEKRDGLRANLEAARAHQEAQELARKKKKEARCLMDDVLNRQIAERAAKAQRSRDELLEAGRKNEQLLAEEEQRFRQYAAEVIEAAAKNDRNTFALRKAARQTKVD